MVSKMAPGGAQEPQEASKRPPRCPQEAPKCSQDPIAAHTDQKDLLEASEHHEEPKDEEAPRFVGDCGTSASAS